MLPKYGDFLIKRFEQPDEVRTFEKGKFETVKIGSMTNRSRQLQAGMEMVDARGSGDWRAFMRCGTCRPGYLRLRRLPDEGRPLLRDAGRKFVLHRPRPRQLGRRR